MQVHDAQILRGAAVATAVISPVALGVCWAFAGGAGAVAAALGVAVVAVFFSLSIVALSRVSAQLLMPAALSLYLAKILALGGLLLVLRHATFLDHTSFGWSIFAATVVWLGAEVTLFRRAKILYVDPAARDPR